jgi:hypothetical protein
VAIHGTDRMKKQRRIFHCLKIVVYIYSATGAFVGVSKVERGMENPKVRPGKYAILA